MIIDTCGKCPVWYKQTCTRKPGHRIDVGPLEADATPPGWCPMAEVRAELVRLEAENSKMRDALERLADEKNYFVDIMGASRKSIEFWATDDASGTPWPFAKSILDELERSE